MTFRIQTYKTFAAFFLCDLCTFFHIHISFVDVSTVFLLYVFLLISNHIHLSLFVFVFCSLTHCYFYYALRKRLFSESEWILILILVFHSILFFRFKMKSIWLANKTVIFSTFRVWIATKRKLRFRWILVGGNSIYLLLILKG